MLNMIRRAPTFSLLIVFAMLSSSVADENVGSAAANPRSTATDKAIAEWISQLDDDRYLTREQATRQLLEAGVAALDPLLAVANSDRPEPADRAVWILRRVSRSRDGEQSVAALERMVQLRDRPALVERAELELDERRIVACQARLTRLGAEVAMEAAPFDGVTVVPLLHVRLGEKWRGSASDLRDIAQLRRQLYFRLEGKAVDNEVAKLFEEKERLAFVQFLDTTVTPEAVDGLKARHRDAIIYMRGQALLGVSAENHPTGALVNRVEPGTAAAAAGIVSGDVIASMDGQAVPDFDRLTARIAQHQPGEAVEVEIVRGPERKKLSVTLGSWPDRQ